MLIHGYGQNGRSKFNKVLKDGVLLTGDYNVIVVDWSTAAGASYEEAVKNIPAIGKSIAQMVEWMKLHDGQLHIIGFDLGAHIAGIVGKNAQVDRITGLDPNRRGFDMSTSINRLNIGDARWTEIYHSNGGKLGMMPHIANADYYISNHFMKNINI
jgi:hypothetical protein